MDTLFDFGVQQQLTQSSLKSKLYSSSCRLKSDTRNHTSYHFQKNQNLQEKQKHNEEGCVRKSERVRRSDSKYGRMDFNKLEPEPWTDNQLQFKDYHRMSEQCRKAKMQRERKLSGLSSIDNKSIDKTERRIKTQAKIINQEQQCNRGACSSRLGKTKDQQKFNPVIVSHQEKLRWHFQLSIMMKKKKKMSNMLKMRHFGYIKGHNFTEKIQKVKYDTCVDKFKDEQDEGLENIGNCKDSKGLWKQERNEKSFDLQQLKQVLKSFSRNSKTKLNLSQSLNRTQVSSTKQKTQTNTSRNVQKFKNHEIADESRQTFLFRKIEQPKKSNTNCFYKSAYSGHFSLNKSLSLTKQSYSAHSKNQKPYLKASNNKGQEKNKFEKESVEAIKCIQKIVRKERAQRKSPVSKINF